MPLKLLFFLFRSLPIRFACLLSSLLLKSSIIFFPRWKAVAFKNIELILGIDDPREQARILHESLDVFSTNFVLIANIDKLREEATKLIFNFSVFREKYNKIKKTDKGVVFVGMHYGCFELYIQCYAKLYPPPAVLARGLGIESFDEIINSKRQLNGIEVFNRKGAFRELSKFIKSGKDVVLLMDQNVKANHAQFVDFFGIKAATSKTAFILKERFNTPIIFSSFTRKNKNLTSYETAVMALEVAMGKKKISSSIYDVVFEEISGSNIQELYQDLHSNMEKVIKHEPECWMWVHRRFKTRPKGEKEDIYE